MALVESIGMPTLTVELSLAAISIKSQTGEMAEALRWSQTVIDLADGDPTKGNVVFGSPLAVALASRGTARWALGRAGWRDDFDRALAMARGADPMSHAVVIAYAYGFAIAGGVLLADDAALRDIEEALEITERSSEDFALGWARWALGVALVHRDSRAERERGLAVLGQVRDMCLQGRFYQYSLAAVDVYTARERARRGDRDGAIPQCVEPSTICSIEDSSGIASGRPPFWWRRCWSVVPGMTWPKPRPRSTGWRPRQTTRGWWCAKSGCCGCARCWPAPMATRPPTATIGIATAPWRHRWASRDT